MSNKDNGGPAFPAKWTTQYQGMTLRDYFAAKAMQGLCANNAWLETAGARTEDLLKAVAGASYELADAMLEARK